MHKNYKDPGCYSEFKEISSMEAKFIFAEDKILDNNAPIDSTIRVWSINKINKNFTSQNDTDVTQDNLITIGDSKIDKVILNGNELDFFCRDNKIFSFDLTIQNIDFSSVEALIASKIDTVEIADKTITFKANGAIKGTATLPKDIKIINDLTTGGINKALSAESIKPITEKLTENIDEVISARQSYFGKTFSNLKKRLDKEFEYTSIDNVKGMFSPFNENYTYDIKNSLEGTTRDIEVLGEAYQNLSPFGDKTYTLNKGNHTGTTKLPITIPGDRVITVVFNVLEKSNIQGIMCRGYDNQNNFKEFARTTSVTFGRNILVLKNEINLGIKDILLAIINPNDSDFIKIDKILVLDGDYTNKIIPPFFLGIKSSNEIQNNELKIKSCGKNLFNKNRLERGSILPTSGVEVDSRNKLRTRDFINVKELTSYYANGFGISNFSFLYFYDNNKRFISFISFNNDAEIKFDTPKQARYLKILIQKKDDSNITDDELQLFLDNIKTQIEEGSIPTDYEEYKECIKTIILDTPLMSINKANLREKFHDTLTSDGRIIRRVRKRVITEKNNNAIGVLLQQNWTKTHALFLINLVTGFDEVAYPELLFADSFCLSDRFMVTTKGLFDAQEEGIAAINAMPNYIGVCISKSRLKTPDANGFIDWLKTNPLTVYYSLNTPYEEKINPINFNLETFSGTTHVESINDMQFITNFKAPINVTSSLATYYRDNEKIKNKLLQIEKNSLDIDSKISVIDENLKKLKTLLNE